MVPFDVRKEAERLGFPISIDKAPHREIADAISRVHHPHVLIRYLLREACASVPLSATEVSPYVLVPNVGNWLACMADIFGNSLNEGVVRVHLDAGQGHHMTKFVLNDGSKSIALRQVSGIRNLDKDLNIVACNGKGYPEFTRRIQATLEPIIKVSRPPKVDNIWSGQVRPS